MTELSQNKSHWNWQVFSRKVTKKWCKCHLVCKYWWLFHSIHLHKIPVAISVNNMVFIIPRSHFQPFLQDHWYLEKNVTNHNRPLLSQPFWVFFLYHNMSLCIVSTVEHKIWQNRRGVEMVELFILKMHKTMYVSCYHENCEFTSMYKSVFNVHCCHSATEFVAGTKDDVKWFPLLYWFP